MFSPGTRLGAYELIAPLGTGGMGQVYRARDTRLGRDVALKVLPTDLAEHPSSLARFEQEARTVAALNHPNIVALHDVGTENGVAYIVTELVDGMTLRGARPPVRKVTEIGAQICDGLAAAHGAGVTHRDIKPDNVMLTRDDQVKVLDFGVAKATRPAAGEDVTAARTHAGAIVGTIGYMAPEQVRGDAVDHRADIFAVGVLLHELLAGERVFTGDTAAEIMAATLKADPPELPPNIPVSVRQIVHRCLQKNPAARFQSVVDLAFALRHLTDSSITAAGATAVDTGKKSYPRARIAAAGFALGIVLMGAVAITWTAAQDAAIDPVQLTRITADRRNEFRPALSPDGRSLAYLRVGGILTELLVSSLDDPTPIALASAKTAITDVVWSSDGNQVCYTDVARAIWCVGAAGGSPRSLLSNAVQPQFAPDGSAVFFVRVFQGQPWLFRSTLPHGEPHRVGDAPLPAGFSELSPVSPDGTLLVAATDSERWLISLRDGTRRELPVEDGAQSRSIAWHPDSRHLAVAEETTTLIGSRLVIEDTRSAARRLVLRSADPITDVSVSRDGARLVYAGGPLERDVVEYSSDGRFIRGVGTSSMLEGFPSWSPASDRFVYRVGGPGRSDSLWIGSLDQGAASPVQQLTSNSASQTRISPDGGRLAYMDPSGIHVVSTSGGRAVRVLSSDRVSAGLCWSPDGEWIWYSEGPTRLGKVPSQGGEPVIVPSTPGPLLDCSPDGRWLARRGPGAFLLTSTETGQDREAASSAAYASRADNAAQFGEQGQVLYLLGLDRRSIDVLDVTSGRMRRTILFDIPSEDQIEGFSFNAAGTRVLLTTGGDRNDLWMAEGFGRPSTSWRRWFRHWESSFGELGSSTTTVTVQANSISKEPS